MIDLYKLLIKAHKETFILTKGEHLMFFFFGKPSLLLILLL